MVLGFKVGPPGGNGLMAKVVRIDAEATDMANISAKVIAAFFLVYIVSSFSFLLNS